METLHSIYPAALCIAALNLPFGFWRAGVRRLSIPWFLSIHLPVPFVIGIRCAFGLPLRLSTFPILMLAFFGGQFLGARYRTFRSKQIKRQEPV